MTDLAPHIWSQLQAADREWLQLLAQQAGPHARIALVGGAVRDALLDQTPQDLDVVAEGTDVQALTRATGLPFLFHPVFQNATVTLPDGRNADLVRARRESYPVAGQNPVPQSGTLSDDLRRRDFAVNALALLIGPGGEVTLLDELEGLSDLEARVLRPLHPKSLHEDASRLVRGARLAARLGFVADAELLRQVPDALAVAEGTPRLWAELKLLLSETRPGRAARTLDDWGAGKLLPGVKWLEKLDDLQDAGQTISPQLYSAAALHASPDADQLAERLGLGDRPAGLLARALSDSYFSEDTPERILRGLLRPDAPVPLTGRDVLALGVSPGRAVGEALNHLAELRQRGKIRSREDEQAALQKYLGAEQG
ncbi:CCA tRNA nucleotidyltransferase [Deinococcus arenicola]|uniref:CCA tRNA nucleotidyltransferase n=1 Tax=Deinococcus arenicola TaxID=2994950 RepID=A0ABU4DPK7_9DEIO|nr:CCA tRNA nucleotidyltransferase [Deinococcus sp. ZS9-10]MDV6374352.1 CCA tRNA nucleotidyltransferase [Deinococcus sp. ZS9-10]